jgi:hypothetical protein
MAIFRLTHYVVKADCLKEHQVWGKNLVATMKKQPSVYKEVKSLRVFSQKGKDGARGYFALWEFRCLADKKKWESRFQNEKEYLGFSSDFMGLVVPGSFSSGVWRPVKSMRRKRSK